MQWKEINLHLPDYTIAQLKEYHTDLLNGEMESNYPKDRTPLSPKDLQSLANTIRRLKLRGLTWTEIGLRFRQYSLNRLRSLYIEANKSINKKQRLSLGRPPKKGRPRSEVDVEKVGEYRAKEMTWKEIQAHMPDWSESTLQRAYGEKAPRLKPLGRFEVKKIAKLRAQKLTWAEVQAYMPDFGESRIRRAFAQGKKEGII